MVKDDFKKLYNQRTMDWFIRHNFEYDVGPLVVVNAYRSIESIYERFCERGILCLLELYKKGILKDANKR